MAFHVLQSWKLSTYISSVFYIFLHGKMLVTVCSCCLSRESPLAALQQPAASLCGFPLQQKIGVKSWLESKALCTQHARVQRDVLADLLQYRALKYL